MDFRAGSIHPRSNPSNDGTEQLAVRIDRESLSTLVHEQTHVWRRYFGPLNRRGGKGANGYHDTVWRDEMLRIGLPPSDTGEPGGKMLGYRMSHYVEEGGPGSVPARARPFQPASRRRASITMRRLLISVAVITPAATSPIRMVHTALISGVTPRRTCE